MNRGKLLELGALLDILKVKIQGHEIILAHVQPAVLEALRPMCEEITLMSDRVHIRAATSRQAGAIVSQAVSGGSELVSVNPIRASLEEYFFQEVQKS